ncbi:MAG: hypothetical protein AAB965_01075 [Patescibacteria group bacterium]
MIMFQNLKRNKLLFFLLSVLLIYPVDSVYSSAISSSPIWTLQTADGSSSQKNWSDIAISADGTRQTAVVRGGFIYVKSVTGSNWVVKNNQAGAGNWSAIAMSRNGLVQSAVAQGGLIWSSANGGEGWSPISHSANATTRNWSYVAMSADGVKQVATVYGGQIYRSLNSGVSFG